MVKSVISFLDILGWKGIWINHSDGKPIDYLTSFIEMLESTITSKFPNSGIKTICFSDTIIIYSPEEKDFQSSILEHAEMCQWALEISIGYNLLLRGVIGYGEYSYSDKIVVGSVIDEISGWNNKVDWLGVILAPSILFESRLRDLNLEDSKLIIKYESIPFKEKMNGLDLCIKWGYAKKVLLNFIKNQKYVPSDVIPKYLNTFLFFDYLNGPDLSTKINNIEKYILRTGAILDFGTDFNDLFSVVVQEISIDSKCVRVIFNLNNAGNLQPEESILKINDFRTFENFSISVKSIFIGTESSLVEFEVEWFT